MDFRVDEQSKPWILEVNANPCLSPDAGFAAALAGADLSLTTAVEWIMAEATRPNQAAAYVSDEYSVLRISTPHFNGPPHQPPRHSPFATHHSSRTVQKKPRSLATKIRNGLKPADREHVRRIVAATGLFRPAKSTWPKSWPSPGSKRAPPPAMSFCSPSRNVSVVGYVCYGNNTLTVSSFDIYWIAVDSG